MSQTRRVVSLAPSNTEIVWALGALDRLVGADDHSDFPSELDVVRVGPDLQIDVEAVAALEPDLVLASLSVPGMDAVVEAVRERGLPSMVLAPKSFADVIADHVRVGEALGIADRAQRVADGLRGRIQAVRAATEGVDRVRVFWEWWPRPLITAGAGSWMTELIHVAGGVNVAGDLPDESPQMDVADVPPLRPDVVGVCWCGTLQRVLGDADRRIAERPGWSARVLALDEGLFGRPGPRLVEGLELLAWLLHPDRVGPPDLSGRVRGLVPRDGEPVLDLHGGLSA